MSSGKNNDKNKSNSPLPLSTPVAVFLIAEKLLTLLLKTFSLFLLNVL